MRTPAAMLFSGFLRSEMPNRRAVTGSTCIKPCAPAEDTAFALKFDSAWITALISAGGNLYFTAAFWTFWAIICRSVKIACCWLAVFSGISTNPTFFKSCPEREGFFNGSLLITAGVRCSENRFVTVFFNSAVAGLSWGRQRDFEMTGRDR